MTELKCCANANWRPNVSNVTLAFCFAIVYAQKSLLTHKSQHKSQALVTTTTAPSNAPLAHKATHTSLANRAASFKTLCNTTKQPLLMLQKMNLKTVRRSAKAAAPVVPIVQFAAKQLYSFVYV